ncbi:sensor histidine kinase [Paenibacillus flagellatus]|uniref:histidine kinase n=1 Tax=Paenibacillus flagellatus TaxID=2211139 RepID=A0A2V5KCC9_9BACL|nr:HAMP domain-containing sensor histidine kinase [Paenibacillus flagellatus]PYI57259.1 sensor histidine kinase [Paenibacillus flagellatus]
MNVRWRLTLRLIGWLAALGLVLLLLAAGAFGWISQRLLQIEAGRNFASAGLQRLLQTMVVKDGKLHFDPGLLEQVRQSGGWLQLLDGEGRVTEAFFTPPDVPDRYGPGELTAYWLGKEPFPYSLYLWIQEKDGVTYTLLYGMSDPDERLLESMAAQGVLQGDKVVLPERLKAGLERNGSWLQVLDADGTERAAFNKPEGALSRYSPQELALRSIYPDRYGTKLVVHFDADSGRTWALSAPLPGNEPGRHPVFPPEIRALAVGIGALALSVLLVLLVVSYWFGHRIGSPLLHMMKWLRALDESRYAEPAGPDGRPRSRNRRGKRKANYRMYDEVLHSFESLSETLRRNERLRAETERMRDEWIAGVSHDLKTPLSSIRGYAHMLETDAYDWSPQEVRSFARIVLDKAQHMDGLINDLALTYRLRSGGQAPELETVDLNEFMAEAVREASSHPRFEQSRIRFSPADRPAPLVVYKPWLQRITDNLVANALLHNGEGTTLTVSVRSDEQGAVTVAFEDDGEGMDEATKARLFDRYYRGTDSESRGEGTGLGMAISKALTEALGGTIEVESDPGRGTAIRVLFPSARSRGL